jgi:hypothetical protein
LCHRLRQEPLGLHKDPLSQSRSVTGHSFLVGGLFRSVPELEDRTD